MEISWHCQLAQVYVPIFYGAMNKIIDLHRDLHANDFAPCEESTFGTRTPLFAFHFG